MGIMPYFTPFRSVIEPHRAKKQGLAKVRVAQIITIFLLIGLVAVSPGLAKADHNNYPPFVDWGMLENWTYAYDYEMFENSEVVELLQFWLDLEQDGIYGPQTNRAHRQRAMERGIRVTIHEYIVQDRDFGPAVEQWRSTVLEAILAYGGSATDVPKFLRIMRCESGGDPEAYNQASGASGLMQHLDNYFPWRAKMAGFEGASPFDGVANIYTSAWLIYAHTAGGWQHWVCQ